MLRVLLLLALLLSCSGAYAETVQSSATNPAPATFTYQRTTDSEQYQAVFYGANSFGHLGGDLSNIKGARQDSLDAGLQLGARKATFTHSLDFQSTKEITRKSLVESCRASLVDRTIDKHTSLSLSCSIARGVAYTKVNQLYQDVQFFTGDRPRLSIHDTMYESPFWHNLLSTDLSLDLHHGISLDLSYQVGEPAPNFVHENLLTLCLGLKVK